MSTLEDIARSQKGLIFTDDLLAMGFDRNAWPAVVSGLVRVARGAYALTEPSDPQQWHLLRTVAALYRRPTAMATQVLAAIVHGFPLFDADLSVVHLMSPRSARSAATGIHCQKGPTDAAVEVEAVRVSPAADTVVDCARSLPLDQGLALTDFALHRGVVTAEELRERLAAPRTGVSRARHVVALADGRCESVGESRTRLILQQAGIAVTPQVVVRQEDGEFIARVDLMVDGYPIVVEFDGAQKYRSDPAARHWQEKRRQEKLRDAGYLVVHVYWDELYRPDVVVAKVRRAIARAIGLRLQTTA